MIHIYPSLMVVNPAHLHKEIALLQPACAGFHLDIMDNVFVPNEMWNSPQEVNDIVKMIKYPWIHLMVEKPDAFYGNLFLPSDSLVSFHIESNVDIFDFAKTIKEKKQRVSIAIRPKTPISDLIPFLGIADHILLMSVEPGLSGQQFLENTYERLAELVAYRKQNNIHFRIGVDGGINQKNIHKLAQNSVDDFAIASAIFQSSNHVATLEALEELKMLIPV